MNAAQFRTRAILSCGAMCYGSARHLPSGTRHTHGVHLPDCMTLGLSIVFGMESGISHFLSHLVVLFCHYPVIQRCDRGRHSPYSETFAIG